MSIPSSRLKMFFSNGSEPPVTRRVYSHDQRKVERIAYEATLSSIAVRGRMKAVPGNETSPATAQNNADNPLLRAWQSFEAFGQSGYCLGCSTGSGSTSVQPICDKRLWHPQNGPIHQMP